MKKYTFEQYTNTRIYTFSIAYSPDGKWIGSVNNESGQFNLWLIESGTGEKRQMTHFTDWVMRTFLWSPDGKRIALCADQSDDMYQIFLLDVETCEITPVTDKPGTQHYFGSWSPDGKILTFTGNEDIPTDMDIYLYHVETGERQRIPTESFAFVDGWSPDGRYLQFEKSNSNIDQTLFLYDTRDGAIIHTTAHEEAAKYVNGPWAKDGSGFYLRSDDGREFMNLGFYDLNTRQTRWAETPDADIEMIFTARNAPVMVWVTNDGGRSSVFARNLDTGEALSVPPLPLGVIQGMSVSPDGTRLALTFARPSEAPNLYEFDIQSGEMRALGQSMLGGIDQHDLIEPELVTYETFDGRKIPAWLYKPRVGDGLYPVLLSIHGGPDAQERPVYNYNGFYQYLLSRGIGVLAPNIRGSTGYGHHYQKLIYRDWGGDDLKDIEHAAKYLQGLDWVDSNCIAVFGGSYGGFATLSAISRLPDYWKAAVATMGPSNLVTFVKSVPPMWRRMMKSWVGDPEEDHDFLIERSPITYVDQIRAPLLVIQGARDRRVVKAESDQMVERIRANGGVVQYYVDENEGHGAQRRENWLTWYTMIGAFLEEHLLQ